MSSRCVRVDYCTFNQYSTRPTNFPDWRSTTAMDILDTLYTVSLQDYPGLPTTDRMKAETRFCATIERLLGGSEGVAKAYGAWCVAADADGAAIDPEEDALAKRWTNAFDRARGEGIRILGECDSAFFEVRLG